MTGPAIGAVTLGGAPLPPRFLAEHTMGMPVLRRHWTTADVRALMDESRHWPRYELIDGELLVTPAPGVIHQVAVTEIWRLVNDYVERERFGVTLTSPADVELREGNITQPDVFVVPAGMFPAGDVVPTWPDVTGLLLAVEIISPSSIRVDRVTKRDHYLDVGVPEYWIVDLDARIIERWTPERSTPLVESSRFEWTPKGADSSLVVDVTDLFGRIWGKLKVRRI
jgi:Uma2 family endonuclease